MCLCHRKCLTSLVNDHFKFLEFADSFNIFLCRTGIMIISTHDFTGAKRIHFESIGTTTTINVLVNNQIQTHRLIDIRTIRNFNQCITLLITCNCSRLKSIRLLQRFQHLIHDHTERKQSAERTNSTEYLSITNGIIINRSSRSECADINRHKTIPITSSQEFTHLFINKQNTIRLRIMRRFLNIILTCSSIVITNIVRSIITGIGIILISVSHKGLLSMNRKSSSQPEILRG